MRRTIAAFLGILMLASWAGASAQTPGASPQAMLVSQVDLERYLLTGQQVPDGLVVIMDGRRTLPDVVSGFRDPDEAMERFKAWGWQGNVVRAFHAPENADIDPQAIDGIYMSIHAFGTPEEAAEALAYTADAHADAGDLRELDDVEIDTTSRVLYGEMSYGDEVTIYAQEGNIVIRLSAASPKGDPTNEAVRMVTLILDQTEATPTAAPPGTANDVGGPQSSATLVNTAKGH